MVTRLLSTALEIVGATCIVVGVALVSVSAAWVVAGVCAVLKAYELDRS